MNYDKDTKNAYRNELKAKEYQEQYTKGTKWARFTMWRQKVLIKKIIEQCNFKQDDKILDIPCGTGFIGKILCNSLGHIIASDISIEMMNRASREYQGDNFRGFVQCDVTQTPFKKESFNCVILLALMHRLPKEIKFKTWDEVVSLSKKYIIVNYSIDSHSQRLKQWLTKMIRPTHKPAPSPVGIRGILEEFRLMKLKIKKRKHVVRFFSSVIIFLLEKSE
jgi:ubiquinone/menaquinone biosynthesis C-methylase UbiE